MKLIPVHKFWLAVALGLATVTVAWMWRTWLSELLLRPFISSGMWFVYYVTHLPQMAVWFAALFIITLVGFKALGHLANVAPRRYRSRKRLVEGPRGPVSTWQQMVELSASGYLYQHKLRRFLRQQADALDDVSPKIQRFLADARRRRFDPQADSNDDALDFDQLLRQTLDELAPQGDRRATR